MLYSTITSKGQTTVPIDIREMLDLKPGDRIVYQPLGKGNVGVVIKRQKMYSYKDLMGALPKPDRTLTIEEMNQAIGEAVSMQHARALPKRKPKK